MSSFVKWMWIGNGVLWGLLIVGFISLVVFNRVRNRKGKGDDD